MKKIAVFLVITSLLLQTVALVKADTIADPNDSFNVNYPLPNQQVKGTIPIKFRIFDDQQSNVSYNIKLFDFATCRDSYLGDISSGTAVSNKNTDFTVNWNTKTTSTIATLNDGNYCVRVCVAMIGQATPYTACNGRFVKVSNNNRLPVINSQIPAITIKESESWQYQIKASDPDGDSLKYYLIKSAFFLQINQNTGVISTNSLSKKLPDNVARVDYNITYAVDDNMSGQVYQDFTISIVRDQPLVQPTSAPGVTSPGPTVNNPSQIKIIIPNKNTLFRDKENTIKWEVTDDEGIKSITLQYSVDQVKWTQIATLNSGETEYVWDVSDLEDESYYLQLTVEDNQGVTTTKVSDKFAVQNKSDVVSDPLIVSIKPENNELTEVRPTISGELVPSTDSTINNSSFKIKIEDWDITSLCKLTDNKFVCTLDKDLEPGLHKLSIEFKDSNDKKANSESVFKVKGEVVSYPSSFPLTTNNNDTINILGRDYPRHLAFLLFLLCCSCLILLLAPLMLITIWSERRRKVVATSKPTPLNTENLQSSYQTYLETPAPYVQAVAPLPTVTTNYVPVDQPVIIQDEPTAFVSQTEGLNAESSLIQPNTFASQSEALNTENNSIQPTAFVSQTEGLNAESSLIQPVTFASSENLDKPKTDVLTQYTEPTYVDGPVIQETPVVQPVIIKETVKTEEPKLPPQVSISDVAREQDSINKKEFDPESFEQQWQRYYQSEALTQPAIQPVDKQPLQPSIQPEVKPQPAQINSQPQPATPTGPITPPPVVTDSQGNVDYSKMVDDLYKPRN